MANLSTLVLKPGKEELLQPDVIASPKYFKITSEDIPLQEDVDISQYQFWFQKNIDVYKIIDDDTIEFTCIIEAVEAVQDTKGICLFFENSTGEDIPFLLGILTAVPAGNRQIITLQFKLTKASTKINFEFITSDKFEEGLVSLNTLITLGNQITKNSTLLSKIYLPDVLNTPAITAETFTIT